MLQSPSTSTRVGGNIVSGVVPLGNVSWMLFQKGRSSTLRSRQGVGRLLALVVNPVASILEFNVCEQSELQEDKDSGARSWSLQGDQCVCTGRCRERGFLLLLGENIQKIKGGYCPESSWSRSLCCARLYNMTPRHEMDFNTGTRRVTLVSVQANLHVNTQLTSGQWNNCVTGIQYIQQSCKQQCLLTTQQQIWRSGDRASW